MSTNDPSQLQAISFSEEQRQWLEALLPSLNRDQMLWLSGWMSGAAGNLPSGLAPAAAPTTAAQAPAAIPPAAAPAPIKDLTVLYATESGNSEALADEVKKQGTRKGFRVKVKDVGEEEPDRLAGEKQILIIASTWGEGDPPERAIEYTEKLFSDQMPKLNGLRYSVLALGDTSYEHFCKYGKDLDERLEALGASRFHPRTDCDVDFEEPFQQWLDGAFTALDAILAKEAPAPAATPASGVATAVAPAAAASAPAVGTAAYDKQNPFPAEVMEKINLNGTGSAKETIHLELSLAGSGLTYEVGDSLGVVPRNCPQEVDELIQTLKVDGDREISIGGIDGTISFREALQAHFDATNLSRPFIEKYAGVAESAKLNKLIKDRDGLKEYLQGRQLIDLFSDFPAHGVDPQELAPLFRKLPPRLYSIASSLKAHPDEVHLTVAAVRYHAWGRGRKGVCSSYLADRVDGGQTVPVYVQKNKHFRLPESPDTPIIMVGPGTGIAPFRAFVEERAATGAKGRNWLFFGDQHYLTDFLYQTEWQDYLKEGVLDRLDVAFSRDTPEKVYVQHKLLQNARELYAWLEDGAHFYVCGDATRMAKDVSSALQQIVSEQAKVSSDEATAYLKQLKKEGRFQQDVY